MSEPNYKFYGVNNSAPLSLAHNTEQWNNSIIGKLNTQTNGEIYIREIPAASRSAEYGWRVVDATYSQEDSLMTYFRAYGLDGEFLPEAAFGVNYTTVPHTINASFKYEPEW